MKEKLFYEELYLNLIINVIIYIILIQFYKIIHFEKKKKKEYLLLNQLNDN